MNRFTDAEVKDVIRMVAPSIARRILSAVPHANGNGKAHAEPPTPAPVPESVKVAVVPPKVKTEDEDDGPEFSGFTETDLDRFHDYFAAGEDGIYHGELHRTFRVSRKKFADATGLVMKPWLRDGKYGWGWAVRQDKPQVAPAPVPELTPVSAQTDPLPVAPPEPGMGVGIPSEDGGVAPGPVLDPIPDAPPLSMARPVPTVEGMVPNLAEIAPPAVPLPDSPVSAPIPQDEQTIPAIPVTEGPDPAATFQPDPAEPPGLAFSDGFLSEVQAALGPHKFKDLARKVTGKNGRTVEDATAHLTKMFSESVVTFKQDSSGHEHRGKGPGGGQFVKKGDGSSEGSDSDKSKGSVGKDGSGKKGKSDPEGGSDKSAAVVKSPPKSAQPTSKPIPEPAKMGVPRQATKEEHQRVIDLAMKKWKNAPQPTKQESAEAAAGLAAMGANKYRKNLVGNSTDRRKRREKLYAEFGSAEKMECPCTYCGLVVGEGTMEQDKLFTTAQGGRYRLPNLIPSCSDCNKVRGDKPFSTFIKGIKANETS